MQESTNGGYGSVQDSRLMIQTNNSLDFMIFNQDNKFSRDILMQYDATKPYTKYHSPKFNRSNSLTKDFHPLTSNIFINKGSFISNYQQIRPLYSKDSQEKITGDFQMFPADTNQFEPDDLKTETVEPVLIINQLNSDIDVENVIDELLSNQEFYQLSSLCVLVPTSDDENQFAMRPWNSTKCVQLSENINRWNRGNTLYWPQTKISDSKSMKISANGRSFILEGVTDKELYFNSIVITRDLLNYINSICKEPTKNKLCQITTPNDTVRIDLHNLKNIPKHMVSTDTTEDRPCCCKPANYKFTTANKYPKTPQIDYKDKCLNNVKPQLMFYTPNFIRQGFVPHFNANTDDRPKKIKKEICLHGNQTPISISPCHITPCNTRKCCHAPQKNLERSGHISRKEFRSSLQRSCNCSPDQLKQLFELLEANRLKNMKSVACGENMDLTPITSCTKESKPTRRRGYFCKFKKKDDNKIKCCQKQRDNLKHLCACEEQQKPVPKPKLKIKTRSSGCQSAFKSAVVIRGPYGEEIPVLGQTAPSSPENTTALASVGIQDDPGFIQYALGQTLPRNIDYSTTEKRREPVGFYGLPNYKSQIGLVEVLGPLGGYAAIGSGGTYTQAGNRQIRFSAAVGPDHVINQIAVEKESETKIQKEKKRKDKSKVTCDCKTDLVTATETKPTPEYIDMSEDDYNDTAWMDPKLLAQLRSDLCQTTSGFKFNKKPKSLIPGVDTNFEVSLDDAIRYYISLHPEILADLLPYDEQTSPQIEDGAGTSTKLNCECPPIPMNIALPQPTSEPKPNIVTENEESEEENEAAIFRGFRFSMSGKGSASKGLNRILTFK